MTDSTRSPLAGTEVDIPDDRDTLRRISQLVARQHDDRSHTEDSGAADDLQAVQQALDQCWDLLRQRRARRDAGQDTAAAAARPTSTVQNYLQ